MRRPAIYLSNAITALVFATFLSGFLPAVQAVSPLESLLDAHQEDPLPPDEAFQLQLSRSAENKGYIAQWTIADGYYLYREKMNISAAGQLAVMDKPIGNTITDEFFGTTQIFRHQVQVPFRLTAINETIEVRYQGCADLGICYPPIVKQIAYSDIVAVTSNGLSPPFSALPASEQTQIAERISGQSLFLIVIGFLGAGLLLAFTPCVLPMVPIVSGMITSSRHLSTYRAFMLTLFYVLAMALTYAVAGVLVGLSGANLQIWVQTPAVIGVFVAIFVLLSLSMFGLYPIRIPAVIQNRFSQAGNEQKGSMFGAMIMGSASALIVGPCVTPPLVGTLLFIAQTGSAVIGGVALFSLGIGMGIPLLAVGASLGKWVPKPGPLLDRINVLFGVLLLAVAIWLLDRVIPPIATQLLAGILLVLAAIHFLSAKQERGAGLYAWRGLGTAMIIYGVMLLAGVAAGGSSFIAPLKPFVQNGRHIEQVLAFTRVEDFAELQRHLHAAAQTGQPVMFDFYADWCVTCKEMEAFTFNQAKVQEALAPFVVLQADVTQNTAENRLLLKHFDVFGPPAILFFDRDGQELRQARLVGFVSAEKFIAHLALLQATQTS